MAQEIARLIAEITHSKRLAHGGLVVEGPLVDGRRAQTNRHAGWYSRPELGWAARLSVAAGLGAVALLTVTLLTMVLTPLKTSSPQRTFVREFVPAQRLVPAAQRIGTKFPENPVASKPALARSPTIGQRHRELSLRGVKAPLAKVGPVRFKRNLPSVMQNALGRHNFHRLKTNTQVSPHLTGAALQRALNEDVELTRRVNQQQIRTPTVSVTGGK